MGNMSKFIPRRPNESQPRLVTTNPANQRREIAAGVLPKGASPAVMPRRRNAAGFFGGNMPMGASPSGGGGGGGSSMYHMQRPYMPGVESPDRVQYPKSRVEANAAWRLFHEVDPIFGTAIDMYAEMLVSDFDLVVGNEKSGEIRNTLEYMCQATNFLERFKYIVKEYLVLGEAVPHTFFDDTLGIWTHIALHNPDYIEIVDSPLVNMDPIINFVPDENLRRVLSDGTPESREFRSRLPAEFVSKVMARQKIHLSPVNCSFIARKLHPYSTRGTSMASRLWRIFMVEDAVYNSTIATYRRAAAPVKVIKLGDPAASWIPNPGSEAKLLEMLNRAEVDPQAWLIWNYGINYEQWGNQSEAITIDKEHDVIERVKLLGLGLSKSFVTGEVTFAAAKAGLQVFLRRLLSLRQFMENAWIYPKFFKPISEMNDWHTSKPSEVNHRYRMKRTSQEMKDEQLLLVPTIRWKNKLDPTVDIELLQAFAQLDKLGVKVKKSTIASAVNLDYREEHRERLAEFKTDEDEKVDVLGETYLEKYNMEANPQAQQAQQGGAAPPGAPGSGMKPPGAGGAPGGGMNDASKPPGSASPAGMGGVESPSGGGLP